MPFEGMSGKAIISSKILSIFFVVAILELIASPRTQMNKTEKESFEKVISFCYSIKFFSKFFLNSFNKKNSFNVEKKGD